MMAIIFKLLYLSCILTPIKAKFDFDGSLADTGDSGLSMLGEARGISSNMARANMDFSSILPPWTFKIWPYVDDTDDLTWNDCFPKVRPQQEGAFTMIEAESGTQYRAHIVKSEEQNCFVDYYTFKENMTFTQCLEMADSWAAPSFHYDKSTRYCQLYKDWRYRMYSNCRRGSNEKIFYLLNEEPDNHKPCRGVQMKFNATYTADGSVTITGTTVRDYCGCDIDQITLAYLDKEVEMTITPEIPTYSYTYPSASVEGWHNYTTITVYSRGSIVAQNEWMPMKDMF